MQTEDVLGADETGINVIPRATRTLALQGSRQVPGLVKKALAQITKVTCISLLGILLGYQLIFGGKTAAVFPTQVKPAADSFYSATPSHFANATTTLEFVQRITLPFVEANRRRRIEEGKSTQEQEDKGWAVLIWDNFSAHKDEKVEAFLQVNRIKSMFLPPNCTSIYQALDVMFNGNEKQVLRAHFSEWHFETLQRAMAENPDVMDVLPKTASKKRALIATLIRGVHEIMMKKKDLICRAWAKTGLYDDQSAPVVDEEVEMDDLLVREMVRMTLDKDDEVEMMDVDDEFEVDQPNEPAAEADYGIHNLDDDDNDEEDEPEVNAEDVANESDEEIYQPNPKRRVEREIANTMDDGASDSAETSVMVRLTRPRQSGSIRIDFLSRTKPTSAQVLQKLKDKNLVSHNCTLIATFNSDNRGYNVSLQGQSHTSVVHDCGTLVWLPGELN